MHFSSGTNPFTPVATPSGKGIFPQANIADDGDKRNAANAMAAPAAVLDRTNWLGWRTIDIVSGATYTYTTHVTLANQFTWTGAHEFRAGVNITTAGTFQSSRPASITNNWTFGSGLVDFNGTVSIASLISCTQTGPFVKSGDTAYTDERVKVLSASGGTFVASQAEVWIVPALAGDQAWSPASEPGKDFSYVIRANEPTTQNFDGSVFLNDLTVTFKFTASTTGKGAVHVCHRGSTDDHDVTSGWYGPVTNPSAILVVA